MAAILCGGCGIGTSYTFWSLTPRRRGISCFWQPLAWRACWARNPPMKDLQAAWRRLLQEELQPQELEDILSRHAIDPALPRQVMVLKLQGAGQPDAFALLQGLVPVSPQDVMLPLDRTQVALVKSMADRLSQSELIRVRPGAAGDHAGGNSA